jgi:hypothetical protein
MKMEDAATPSWLPSLSLKSATWWGDHHSFFSLLFCSINCTINSVIYPLLLHPPSMMAIHSSWLRTFCTTKNTSLDQHELVAPPAQHAAE